MHTYTRALFVLVSNIYGPLFSLRLLVVYRVFSPSAFRTPALFLRDREEGVGLLARKGDRKKEKKDGK